MAVSHLQELFAERIGGRTYGQSTAIYKFEKIKRAKRAAVAAHPGAEIIDMGVGEPDEMAFPEAVDRLCAEARLSANRLNSATWQNLVSTALRRSSLRHYGMRALRWCPSTRTRARRQPGRSRV